MHTFRLTLAALIIAGATRLVLAAADTNPPAAAPRNFYAEGIAALEKRDGTRALSLLSQVPESDPKFLEAMILAGDRLLAESAGRPERGLPFVERAYRKAPDNMEVAYAYIRVQLLARTNLSVASVAREHRTTVPAEFRFIAEGPKFPDDSKPVAAAKLLADLDYLELMLANGYSYLDRRGADWRAALDALRLSVAKDTPRDTFLFRLHRFMTVFGDPHSDVRASLRDFFPTGYAPFLPQPDGERVLAVKHDRSGFLDADCPYVTALDGVPIADWLRVAGYDVPKASPQYFQRSSVAALEQLSYLRTELGLPAAAQVKVKLASADGAKQKELTLDVLAKRTRHGPWPRRPTGLMDDVGYLRIHSMDSDPKDLAELDEAMKKFRDTKALIIDVRGNGGGSQDTLRTLLPYFLKPDAPMKIVNVAAYRLPVRLPQPCAEGYLGLANRGLYPVTSKVWTAPQRQQIEALLQGFQPDWKLPAGKFSDWHVMGISHATNPKAYYYDRPVIVLSDAGCFSATDNFLGAFQGHPNATVMGATSGGGSGRMASYMLPNTRIPLTICQMASFRANGNIFDGKGVAPDVTLPAQPTDYLREQGDSVLEAARRRLK